MARQFFQRVALQTIGGRKLAKHDLTLRFKATRDARRETYETMTSNVNFGGNTRVSRPEMWKSTSRNRRRLFMKIRKPANAIKNTMSTMGDCFV